MTDNQVNECSDRPNYAVSCRMPSGLVQSLGLWRSWATANAQNSPHSPTRRFCVNNKAIMEGDLLPLMHMEIIGRDPRKYYEDLDVLYPTGPSVEHVLFVA